MNTALSIFLTQLKNRKTYDSTYLQDFKTEINKHRYPSGIFFHSLQRECIAYLNYTFEENYTYFQTWINALFSEYYDSKELHILTIYATLFYQNNYYNLSDDALNYIQPLLNDSSTKDDIQYFLEELKYSYLCTLLENNSSDNTLINNLINALKPIEQSHNEFEHIIGLRKDESQ